MAEEQGTDLSKDESPKFRKPHRGYLVIHDISYEEACELYKSLKDELKSREIYWWPFEEMAKVDNAAGFAILTHGFPNPKRPLKVSV